MRILCITTDKLRFIKHSQALDRYVFNQNIEQNDPEKKIPSTAAKAIAFLFQM